MKWIRTLRPLASGSAALLAAYAYHLAGMPVNIWVVLTVFAISGATMALNDWHDRKHDLLLEKSLATNEPHAFRRMVALAWGVVFILVGVVAVHDLRDGALVLALSVLGIGYSYTRQVLFLPTTVVAICVAGVALSPIVEGQRSVTLSLLTISMFVWSLARETLKDVEHPSADLGWKNTISTTWGTTAGVIFSRYLLVVAGLLLGLAILPVSISSVYGIALFLLGGYLLQTNWKLARTLIDLGLLWIVVPKPAWHAGCAATVSGAMVATRNSSKSRVPSWRPDSISQPSWIWPVMIVLLLLVLFATRLTTGSLASVGMLRGGWQDALLTAVVVWSVFLVLMPLSPQLMPAFEPNESVETPAFRLVKRMSGGMLLGVLAGLLQLAVGLPTIWSLGVTAIIAVLWLPDFCRMTRDRGFQLGTIAGMGLVGGINYSISQFLPPYLLAVVFWYGYLYLFKKAAPA